MTEKRTRLALDGLLTALLIFEMLYQLTGNTLHEVAGIAFFVTIVMHLVLSRKWIAAASRAVSTRRRIKGAAVARMVVNGALALVAMTLLVSSVPISNLLLGLNVNLAGDAYNMWAMVHVGCSYALCSLAVVHLALHWTTMAAVFRVPYDPGRRTAINTGVAAVTMLGILGLEMTGANALAKLTSTIEGDVQSGNDDEATAEATAGMQPEWSQSNRTGKGGRADAVPSASKDGLDGLGSTGRSSEGSSESANGKNSDTTASGICTLCNKRCPLSSPRCNRPYQSGLI